MQLGSGRALAASVLIAMGPALVACGRGHVSSAALTSWESRYVPAEQCRPVVTLDPTPPGGHAAATGTLVVRLASFGTSELAPHGQVVLSPLAPLDASTQPVIRLEADAARPAPLVATVAAGRFALVSHAFGFEARTDTVAVRVGATDTVTVTLEEYAEALRNRHNCRPRGFRRAGEPACLTDQISSVRALDRARDIASPRFRFGVGLPEGDSTDVHVVDEERVCERAARLYGLDTGPPRRVVVVEAGSMYVVYDPAEPVGLGELNQWLILDKRWRVLARLVL